MKKSVKKLALSRETLRHLEQASLHAVGGAWTSVYTCFTCGDNSCLSVCTANCGGLSGCDEAAPIEA